MLFKIKRASRCLVSIASKKLILISGVIMILATFAFGEYKVCLSGKGLNGYGQWMMGAYSLWLCLCNYQF